MVIRGRKKAREEQIPLPPLLKGDKEKIPASPAGRGFCKIPENLI